MGEGMDNDLEARAGNGLPPARPPPAPGAGAGAMAMKNPLSQREEEQPYNLRRGKRRSRQRKCLCCCGVCCAIVVVIVLLLIILIFTVFKQRDPQIHVDSVTLQGLNVNVGNLFTDPLSVDVGLLTTISVKNPNYAGFKYRNTTAYIYYQGIEIGDSPVPAGEVKSRRTTQLSTGTNVHISGSIINGQLANDVAAGVLPVVTTVQISGTAKILNIFNVNHVRTSANCTVDIFIANQTQSFHCDYKVKL